MSRLAEVYGDDTPLLSGDQIAQSRGLPKPFVAKVLSTLVQEGLVNSVRGPGGGFSLAYPPNDIALFDVFCLFEEPDLKSECPFGGGICGEGDKCPLHDRLTQVQRAIDRVLHDTTFETFRRAYRKNNGLAAWQHNDSDQEH